MRLSRLKGASVEGVVTVVPEARISFREDAERLGISDNQRLRISKSVGLEYRHVAPADVTALDLGGEAARLLVEGLSVPSCEIGALIFVTQTPDHSQPCNAAILHGMLGLSKAVAAFDINLGCSGYVYGLFVAINLATSLNTKVLLVAGDTLGRLCNPQDRSTSILFGDAASATLVTPDEGAGAEWTFDFGTDGTGYSSIIVPAGGARNPISTETGKTEIDSDGNVRSMENLFMNGGDVFNFATRIEPQAIKALLENTDTDVAQVDYFFLHQANRYILQTIGKRLQVPASKLPMSVISRYGNQSSASIPCTINTTLGDKQEASVLMSGFGVGLSWGSTLCNLNLRFCPEPVLWRKK